MRTLKCRRYGGPGGPCPHKRLLVPLISVHSEYIFGTSHKDKTTGNNGKKNNNVQTSFSLEVFSILCKIAGHQLLYINVRQYSTLFYGCAAEWECTLFVSLPVLRACERGFRGNIVPGLWPRGGRAQGARKSSGFCVKFWYCTITP